jgi:hypothetical protein
VTPYDDTLRAAYAALADQESNKSVLLAMTPEFRHDDLLAEAARRADQFRAVWAARPQPTPAGMTPLGAAYRSVAHDVAIGYL